MDLGPAPPRSALVEPVPRPVLALLRRAVLDHAGSEHRRAYPPTVHVGTPGGTTATLVLGEQALDHTLRTDVLEAMVTRVTRVRRTRPVDGSPVAPVLVWLTRPGPLETRDVDAAWMRAARSAAAELEQPLPMVVVNRRSWRDPATGVQREWTRMRSPAC